ncbi:MAG: mechanosensitive ion channel domain-containing protein [Acidobacteriota bacterium]|nr:mechanosensitive ion channel domain-containing protein [Acidobacteriota bacterium]
MQSVFENWLVEQGVESGLAAFGATATGAVAVLLLALIADLVAKRVLLRAVVSLTERTESTWDNVVAERRVFHRLAHIAPAIVIYLLAPDVLGVGVTPTTLVRAASLLYMIVVVVSVLDGALNALVDLIRASHFGERLPLTTFAQVVKLVLYGLAAITALSILMDESPALLFSGLGAMTAVLMLVFKDPILGFVGGIQLSANQMVRRGDWIEMPNYGADGDVLEVALTTVKVQNFDKTITTIPTYALISESFKNWRGMAESQGRRIKRAIHLDLNSIKFCDDALLTRLTRVPYMADYLAEKQQEIDTWNGGHGEGSSTALHPRRLTNIGTFRAYTVAYLKHRPDIHQEMTFLVRQLAPTPHGVPIEVYVFSRDQNWVNYEGIQSDIFDHLLAVLPEFDLRAYQIP